MPESQVKPPTGRDNALWQQCWRDRRTAFHQKTVNPLLTGFWSGLGLGRGSRVFVPLCGKSLDMIWLAEQGHEVVGVELSPIAVRAFFRENGLQPTRRPVGGFTLWRHDSLSILCGDYFSLTRDDLGPTDAVYDRAALTALPEDIRRPYVAHLRSVVPPACKIFLLTAEDAEDGETPAQTAAAADEVVALYAGDFEIDLAHVESVVEVDPESPEQGPRRTEHKVYRLSARPGNP
jgi:thiopurine S-methyltransferase